MSADLKQAVSDATLTLLQPLARVLLEAGIGIGEFHAMAKVAFVRSAIEQGKATGRQRPNVSRIAAATGLTRLDVAALLTQPLGRPPPVKRGRSRAENVLAAWHEDREFLDPHTGAPAPLKEKGARRSFAALTRRYAGDTHSAAILHELLRAGAARVRDDGRIEALSRTCANVGWDPESLRALGDAVAEHLETWVHNLEHPEAPHYIRRVMCTQLDAQAAKVVIPEIREHADVFLESTEISLGHPKHVARSESARKKALKFSVSVFCFQGPTPPDGRTDSPRRGARRTRKAKSMPFRSPPHGVGAG